MTHHPKEPSMRQKIFSMRLDVETVSLYLVCCAVVDAGGSISVDILADKWNGSRATLDQGLSCLEKRNILTRREGEKNGPPVYEMVDEKNWR